MSEIRPIGPIRRIRPIGAQIFFDRPWICWQFRLMHTIGQRLPVTGHPSITSTSTSTIPNPQFAI